MKQLHNLTNHILIYKNCFLKSDLITIAKREQAGGEFKSTFIFIEAREGVTHLRLSAQLTSAAGLPRPTPLTIPAALHHTGNEAICLCL